MKVTRKLLEERGCCKRAIIWFDKQFPNGVKITKKNIMKFCETFENGKHFHIDFIEDGIDRKNHLISLLDDFSLYILKCPQSNRFIGAFGYYFGDDFNEHCVVKESFENIGVKFWKYYKELKCSLRKNF